MSQTLVVFQLGSFTLPVASFLIVAMLIFGRLLYGDEIAFISVRDGDAEVYTLDLDRGIVNNVTRNPAWERDFVWSPDGGRLAFYSNRSGEWEVYTIYASGGGSQRLTENRLFETNLVWFRDSEEIAFVVPGVEGNSLVTLNIDNRHYDERNLSQILSPSWSPDGKRIAFFGFSRGTIGLFVMGADGNNRRLIADHIRPQTRDISWSANQKQLVYVAHGEVYVADVGGGEPRQLTDRDGWEPSWSPDGKRIAFMSFRDGNAEIYVMDADGSHLRRLTFNGINDTSPVWRPR